MNIQQILTAYVLNLISYCRQSPGATAPGMQSSRPIGFLFMGQTRVLLFDLHAVQCSHSIKIDVDQDH